MVTEAALWAALADVKDPEIPPVSVVDMGMVHRVVVTPGIPEHRDGASLAQVGSDGGAQVLVEMLPTFVGCPAVEIIRRDVVARLRQVAGVAEVAVQFIWDPPWRSDRITPVGRERLRSWGIAPPPCLGLGGEESGAAQGLEGEATGAIPGLRGEGKEGAGPRQGAGTSLRLGLIDLEEAPPCPYCGSPDTHMENLFGPTACRSIFYCDGCRQPFEGMKVI